MPVSLGARVEREGAPLSVASSSVPCRCRSAGDAYAPTAHSADWGAATLGSRGADGGGGGCGCHGEGGGGLLVPLLFCRLAAGRPRGAEVQVADSTAALERWGRRGLRNSAGGAGSVHGSGRALRKPAPPCGLGWAGPSSARFWLDLGMVGPPVGRTKSSLLLACKSKKKRDEATLARVPPRGARRAARGGRAKALEKA